MSTQDQIIDTPVDDELKTSFLSYAMSVVVSRALPDVRDGLKPVHRRLMYVMSEMNLQPSHGFVKCARVVGEVMGKYHPHGDSAIYEAMVRLAQDWSMRVPLVDGHGNFGTHTDPPAAMRYCLAPDTRIRLADGSSPKISELVSLPTDSEAVVALSVLGRDGKPVKADKVFNSGLHRMLEVELNSGHTIRGSENHPVLALVPVAGVPMLQWLRLDEITEGTVLAVARTAPPLDLEPTPEEKVLGTLLGTWVARGSFQRGRADLAVTSQPVFEAAVLAYDQLVGGPRSTSAVRPGQFELNIDSTAHVNASPLAALAGGPTIPDQVPETVWRGTQGLKRAFLSAVFAAGAARRRGPGGADVVVAFQTHKRKLARDVQDLLLEFGVFATLRPDIDLGGYQVAIASRDDQRAFYTNVNFLAGDPKIAASYEGARTRGDVIPYVAAYLAAAAGEVGPYGPGELTPWVSAPSEINKLVGEERAVVAPLVKPGYRYVRVAEVRKAGVSEVWSVRVATDDHAFLAGGFVNHNTEARMGKAALPMVDEIDEDTVDFGPNYDGSLKEPRVLPAAMPNLLVNGSEGIAVGMATKMAPHNLGEVVEACKYVLRNPKATIDDLIELVPAPDLPTGGILLGVDGAREAYRTGKGAFTMRARTQIVDVTARKKGIVVTELPYQVGAEHVIEDIKRQRDLKRLQGVASVVDLTDRKRGLHMVIECKAGFNPTVVLDELFRTTRLQTNFNIHNLALVDGQPRTLTLLELVSHYVAHRLTVTRRRCEFRRTKAQARAHILEGYLIALANIEDVVKTIRATKDTAAAREQLTKKFVLTDIQANAILEMPLRRLTGLEVEKINTELAELKAQIEELTRLLTDDDAMRTLVCNELDQVARDLGTPRRSQLTDAATPAGTATKVAPAELPDEPCVVTLSSTGLLGRWNTEPFKGARGKNDALVATIATSVRATIGLVTSKGRVVHAPVVEIPDGDAKQRGGAVAEFAHPEQGETVVGLISLTADAPTVALATRNGFVKRVAAAGLPKKDGQVIIGLKDADDVVVSVVALADESDDLVFITSDAQLLRTAAASVRPQGASGAGMAGIKLGDGAHVIAFAAVRAGGGDGHVVTVTDGNGGCSVKTTPVTEFPSKGRATAGVRCQRFGRGESALVAAAVGTGLTGISATGTLVKLPTELGKRDAAGVRVEQSIVAVRPLR